MKKIVILLMVFMVLLQACSSGGGQVNYDSDVNYRKGSSGVEIYFVQNTPPLETYEDTSLQIGIDLHNKGAYDIEEGYLTIDYDPDLLELYTTNYKDFNLEGKSKYNKDGEQQNYFYDGRVEKLSSQSQTVSSSPLIASICYPYRTVVDDLICVAKNYETSKEQGETVCSYSTYSSGGQGAPVVVSSIVPTILPTANSVDMVKAYFDIEITHRGKGLVIDKNLYRSACSGGSLTGLNKVEVSASLSDVPLKCNEQTTTIATLRDGSARVRCSSNEISEDALPYEAPIYVELNYGYKSTLTQSLTVKRG